MENDYLEHYGRKGMKWGQHIFGDQKETAKYVKDTTKTIINAAEELWKLSDEFDVYDKEYTELKFHKPKKTRADKKRLKELEEIEDQYAEKFNNLHEVGHEALNKLFDDRLDDNEDADRAVETLLNNPKVMSDWFLNYHSQASLENPDGSPYGSNWIDYWKTLKLRSEYAKKRKSAEHTDGTFEGKTESLEHYGRKGMKWYQHIYGEVQPGAQYAQKGVVKVSKSKKKGDAALKRAKEAAKTEPKKEEKAKKKSVSELSDAELEKVLKRARMEDEYRRLQPQKVSLGKQLMKNVLVPVLEQQAKNYLNAKIGNYVSQLTKPPQNTQQQANKKKGKK